MSICEQFNDGSTSSKPGTQIGTRIVSSDGSSGVTEKLNWCSASGCGSFEKFTTPEACVVAANAAMRSAANARLTI